MLSARGYMNKNVHCDIHLGKFLILDIIPRRNKDTVVMLIPIDASKNRYMTMRIGNVGTWYCTIDQMMGYCTEQRIISPLRAAIIKHRYEKVQKRTQP